MLWWENTHVMVVGIVGEKHDAYSRLRQSTRLSSLTSHLDFCLLVLPPLPLSPSPPRYAKSVLGAFSKTVASGLFPVVVVDNINVRVCDFEPFWGNAKRAGFEVYVRRGCMGSVHVCIWAYVYGCMCDRE